MNDTLKSIAQGMEHTANGGIPELHVAENCTKCRLLALVAEYEKVDLVQRWLNSLSQCVGYPTCDGDLVATDHSPACPEYGRERAAIGVRQCAAELITWLAVNVERIKAEARREEARNTPHDSDCKQGEWLSILRITSGCTCGREQRIAELEAQATPNPYTKIVPCPWCGIEMELHDTKRHIKRCPLSPRPRK